MFIKITKRASITAICLCLACGCCKENSQKYSPPKKSSSSLTRSPLLLFSEADVDKLPPEEKKFYDELNPSVQPIFLSLSPEERSDALAMSKPMSPSDAVHRAADHDVYSLPLEQQILYFKLTPKIQVLFLALAAEASDQAVKLSQDTDPNDAVKKAAVDEVNQLIKTDQDMYSKLNLEMQTLFLTLTPQVRSAAVIMAQTSTPTQL